MEDRAYVMREKAKEPLYFTGNLYYTKFYYKGLLFYQEEPSSPVFLGLGYFTTAKSGRSNRFLPCQREGP